jgi:hypothetical protein
VTVVHPSNQRPREIRVVTVKFDGVVARGIGITLELRESVVLRRSSSKLGLVAMI